MRFLRELARELSRHRWAVLALLGGAAVVIGWLLLAGFPLAGLVAGVIGLVSVAWLGVRYRKEPSDVLRCLFVLPIDLVRALAPLVLVVLFLILYATRAAGMAYQLAAAAALATAIALVAGGEWPMLKAIWDRFRSTRGRGRGALVAIVVVVLAIPTVVFLATFLIARIWEGVEEYGGTPAAVELSGLLLVLGAAVFRLGGFAATTPHRRYLTPVMALSAAMIAAIWGFLPGSDGHDALGLTAGGWLAVAAAALFIVAAVEADRALRSGGPPRRTEPRATTPALVGLACAVAGGAAVALALVLVGYDQANPDPGPRATSAASPGALARPVKTFSDRALALMFAPVLALDSADKEIWLPTAVNDYVEDARLLDLTGHPGCTGCTAKPRLFNLPTSCPTAEDSCYVLSCAEGDGKCADRQPGDPSRAAIYARVVRKTKEADAFRGPEPWRDRVSTMIQYWLFYPYNRWRAVTPFGFLRQEHEGDWEFVGVGLGDDQPLFVAYSAHCGGEWHSWGEIEVVAAEYDGTTWRETADRSGFHPLVAVATGSHANYLGAWRERPPDWGTCRRIPQQATWALSFASNVRDRTASVRRIRPQVRIVHATHPAMSFSGRWGRSDVTSIGVFGKKPVGEVGLGPTSPALKDVWRRPLSTIFCGKHWRPDSCG